MGDIDKKIEKKKACLISTCPTGKIYVYFYEPEINKHLYFGEIVESRLHIEVKQEKSNNIFNSYVNTKIPNPTLEFYIELGEELRGLSTSN